MLTSVFYAIGPAGLINALIVINVVAFALFGIDKNRAEQGAWRIREKTLLTWALFGGTPGAYAGRALFRHKNRKQNFSESLHAIAILQVTVLTGTTVWWFWPA